MTAKTTVTGNIAEPKLRFTQTGRPVLDLSIGCTPRRKNKDTGEWENVGADLWIRASVWDAEAEKWGDRLQKGDRITIDGELMKRTYTTQDGHQGETLELAYPRILGYDPKQTQPQQPQPNINGGFHQPGATWTQPAGGTQNDPWATNQTQPQNTPMPQGQQTPFQGMYDQQPPF